MLDRRGVEYLLGGSLGGSIVGEPRSTVDIDLAIVLPEAAATGLLRELEPAFFVDAESALEAVRRGTHFDVLHR